MAIKFLTKAIINTLTLGASAPILDGIDAYQRIRDKDTDLHLGIKINSDNTSGSAPSYGPNSVPSDEDIFSLEQSDDPDIFGTVEVVPANVEDNSTAVVIAVLILALIMIVLLLNILRSK